MNFFLDQMPWKCDGPSILQEVCANSDNRKTYFAVIINICGIRLSQKLIYKITTIVYLSFKVNSTSTESNFRGIRLN